MTEVGGVTQIPRWPSLSLVYGVSTGLPAAGRKRSGIDPSAAACVGVEATSRGTPCELEPVTHVRTTLAKARRTNPRATLARVTFRA